MLRKLILLGLLAALTIPLLSGCWSRKELNNLAIVSGMGIDKSDRNRYHISIQVVNPDQLAGRKAAGGQPAVIVFETDAGTISEALRKITTLLARKPYMSHLRVLIFGESLAREGIGDSLDFLSRYHEFRTDFPVIIAKNGNAKDLLTILTPLEKIPANKLFDSLTMSEKEWAPTRNTTLDDVINDLMSDGKQTVISAAQEIGNKDAPDSRAVINHVMPLNIVQFVGLAVFREDKLIGWLNTEESKGYNFLTNHVYRTTDQIECPSGGSLSLEILRTKTKIKGYFVHGQPRIHVFLQSETNVSEVRCPIDLTKVETIEALEKSGEKQLIQNIERTVSAAQDTFKVDIFGFGEVIHRVNPKAWKTLKNDWNQHFSTMKVQVTTEVKIRRLGTTNNTYKEQIRKNKE
jgi:spore germination protein KC